MKFNFTKQNLDGYINVMPTDKYNGEYGFVDVCDISPEIVRYELYTACNRTDIPIRFDVCVGKNGTYNVRIVSENGDGKMTIMSDNRRFMFSDYALEKDKKNVFEFTVNVCDYHKHNCEYEKRDCIQLMFMGDVAISTIEIEKVDAPTIYFAGDSTVTDQPAEYPYNPSSTYCGWGQMLGGYLKKGIAVSNHAQSGSTTQDFKECNWLVVKERLKKGDMLFVEFGHNDQKVESLDAFGGYADNLRYYVNEARKAGAIPVLCSPINRIIFQEDGTLLNLLGEYRKAVKSVAEEMNVAFVDMWSKTTEYFEADGAVHAWSWFWGDGEKRDYTHTNDFGGALVAKFGAQEIVDKKILPVCDFVKTELISVKIPNRDNTEKIDMSKELEHVSTVGLVNVPKGAIPDIDEDITNI